MESGQESGVPAAPPGGGIPAQAAPSDSRAIFRLRVRDVQLYHLCEFFTELLIYLMVLFSPWAFGTTEDWSMRTMNMGGYVLGGLLAVKLGIRWLKGHRPLRWGGERQHSHSSGEAGTGSRWLNPFTVLAVLTAAILAYCWISAVNARAALAPESLEPVYRNRYIPWLPHSMDANRSWAAFWNYLAMACSFWAIIDWLPGKSAAEEHAEGHHPASRGRAGSGVGNYFPARLRRLLWVLAINGGLLGLEGIAQRIEGSGLLLFLVRPQEHPTADAQFGPYAYRSNAAQYFNLLWPVCVGLWWMLNRSRGFRQAGHHVVLVCALIMAACPIITTSRLGAVAAAGMLLATPLLLLTVQWLDNKRKRRKEREKAALWMLGLAVGALALGMALGWRALAPRFAASQVRAGLEAREDTYRTARQMADEYPVFGTGPGTFATVFSLYRKSTETYWHEQLHNDWLETLITFGWVGSALVALAFLTVLARWFVSGGIHGGRRFMVLMWLSFAGCLAQARWDFPFQVYSILFLFLVLCAITMTLTRRA